MSQSHSRSLTRDRAHQIVSAFRSKRVLVAGDVMLDEFLWGKVSRISPEAPVPVVEVIRESYFPGGAANVARNLREFTPLVGLVGVAGADEAGVRLMDLLDTGGIGTAGVQRIDGARTIVKTRIIARQQQVVRVDRDSHVHPGSPEVEAASAFLSGPGGKADALICADYGKGFLHQPMVDRIFAAVRSSGAQLLVDPNPNNLVLWPGPDVVKPNRAEAIAALGQMRESLDDTASRDRAAAELMKKWRCRMLLLTLGELGMWLYGEGVEPYHTAARAKEVFDVSGAGDTAIALFTLASVSGAEPFEAAEIANAAAGVVVGKLGTATLTPGELIEAFPS